MKTLYLDLFSGLSGDMFIGALLDLGVDFHQLEQELAKLNLEGYRLQAARKQKANIDGVKFDVQVAHEHTHEHTYANGATHVHTHTHPHDDHGHHDHGHAHEHSQAHGPHGGPLVETKHARVELSVFETNVPPRFRLYFFDGEGQAIALPAARSVALETIRPDKKRQAFKFKRQANFLEATELLPEPHEFKVVLKLKRGRRTETHATRFVENHPHHSHDHEHTHPVHDDHASAITHQAHGRTFADIKQLIAESALSDWVKQKSVAVFRRIAVAEGKIHGHPVEEVHFHEVGAVDSIVDIVGACLALELLGKPRVLASAVVEGTGWIHCAHGRFPLPAPATLAILGGRGIALTQCDEPHELVTPTGAALLAEFAESFAPMQNLVASRIGYGLGTRDHQTRPNVVRAILAASASSAPTHDWETDTIAVLETNLDDTNAELLGYFVEKALTTGALDVFHTPIQMKKGRPGVLLTVLCPQSEADKFTELMLRETTAFGVRRSLCERRKLKREFFTLKTACGEVTVKFGTLDGKTVQVAPEYESCKQLAEKAGVPLKHVYMESIKALKS